jgi:hypothetical protein
MDPAVEPRDIKWSGDAPRIYRGVQRDARIEFAVKQWSVNTFLDCKIHPIEPILFFLIFKTSHHDEQWKSSQIGYVINCEVRVLEKIEIFALTL